MKITIERYEQGGVGQSGTARYFVVYDQPPNPNYVAGSTNGSHNESWQTSLANAITYINGITELAGP